MSGSTMALRIAVLIKQIPRFEEMELGADGRLVRSGEVEMNPYCRRAAATGVALAQDTGGRCVVFTMGPPGAEDVLREAIAWGADEGVLISDPAFAGADTLATARALAAAIDREESFDLVLVGRNSVDADTGQVGPQVAELLDFAFVGGARELAITGGSGAATLEHDDGWAKVEFEIPAVVSCAERLCAPCKVDAAERALVPADLIRRVGAELGPGPWGEAGSPTRVGEVRLHEQARAQRMFTHPTEEEIGEVAEVLWNLAGLQGDATSATSVEREVPVTDRTADSSPVVAVLEPGRRGVARELLGAAAALAESGARSVAAVVPAPAVDIRTLGGWGADHVVLIDRTSAPENVAAVIATWCDQHQPWAVLMPSTMWGRELAGRLAVRVGAGLTGDAIDLESVGDRLVSWKPAFGGQLVAAITSTSDVQMVTIRPGVLPVLEPRAAVSPSVETLPAEPGQRVRVLESERDDDVDILASARVIVGIGVGVDHERYSELDEFVETIGGTLAATRRVTDQGWMPRARQVGITGRSVAPDLYVSIGASGRFNHVVGFRSSRTVLAINNDADAEIFAASDIGLVGDWGTLLPRLTAALASKRISAQAR